jgi:hypothetical protein
MANEQLGAASTVASQPTAGGAAPSSQPQTVDQASGKIDLTTLPEFRAWQSQQDKRLAEAQQLMAQMQAQLSQVQAERQQREMEALSALDPAERATALERKLSEYQTQQRQNIIVDQAKRIVAEAGIDWNDPRLAQAKSVPPSDAGLAAITTAVNQILLQELRDKSETAKAVVQLETQRVQQESVVNAERKANEALVNAGVLVSAGSQAATVVPTLTQRDQQIAQFRDEFRHYRGKGIGPDNPGLMDLRSRLRTAGIRLDELV